MWRDYNKQYLWLYVTWLQQTISVVICDVTTTNISVVICDVTTTNISVVICDVTTTNNICGYMWRDYNKQYMWLYVTWLQLTIYVVICDVTTTNNICGYMSHSYSLWLQQTISVVICDTVIPKRLTKSWWRLQKFGSDDFVNLTTRNSSKSLSSCGCHKHLRLATNTKNTNLVKANPLLYSWFQVQYLLRDFNIPIYSYVKLLVCPAVVIIW
jgi:hypothetical protein